MNIQTYFRPNEEFCEEPLHYLDCGLDNIFLRNGFSIDEDDGDKALTITDLDGLHSAIGMHIVLARKAPSGKELRFVRNELGMSQADLARVIGVSDQSVARWEKGQCEANGGAVLALRLIYLLSLLPPDERDVLMSDILNRLHRLMESDETSDEIFLTYSDLDRKWHDPALAA
jgi:DNA-binding transcriptional regulator YiaG